MRNTLTTWCARALLLLATVSMPTVAHAAAIYTFTFTDVADTTNVLMTGTFTTGVASSLDPGYDAMISLTVNEWTAEGTTYTTPLTTTTFAAYSAYNPVTQVFVSRTPGPSFGVPDLGYLNVQGLLINAPTFFNDGTSPTNFIYVEVPWDGHVLRQEAKLTITPPAAVPVPEPTSLVLLGTGLIGAVLSRRRATR